MTLWQWHKKQTLHVQFPLEAVTEQCAQVSGLPRNPSWEAFSPLQYAMRLRLMCRDAILASPRANDNIIITQQSRTFGTSTRSWSSCARGTPFVSFPSGGSDWTAKWHSDSQLSAKSHSARFLVNDDDSARCCCCRCCFPPHGQLDIFNAPLWPYQRRHMSLRVLSLLSLLSSLFSCPSLMCGPR